MPNVLITGGAGFIGTHLANELAAAGYTVRLFDQHWPVIMPFTDREPIEVMTGSILDHHAVSLAVRGMDVIVHLAASLGVKNTDTNRLHCLRTNIDGTRILLDACVSERVRRVVFASSSEIYGQQPPGRISESAPANPLSVYAVSKLAGEELVRAYSDQYDLSTTILRFFNVYGPYQRTDFVIPRFVEQARQGAPITVYGSGLQTRAFCYVTDAARGIRAAIEQGIAHRQTFNIGNDQELITINDLAQRIQNLNGGGRPDALVSYADADRAEERDINDRLPDISLAHRLLGYFPTVSLSDGLKAMLTVNELLEIHP